MELFLLIVAILIALAISNSIVIWFRKLLMKITGAQGMFFSVKGHFIAVVFVTLFLSKILIGIFAGLFLG